MTFYPFFLEVKYWPTFCNNLFYILLYYPFLFLSVLYASNHTLLKPVFTFTLALLSPLPYFPLFLSSQPCFVPAPVPLDTLTDRCRNTDYKALRIHCQTCKTWNATHPDIQYPRTREGSKLKNLIRENKLKRQYREYNSIRDIK